MYYIVDSTASINEAVLPDFRKEFKTNFEIYKFDQEEVTACCEATPSWFVERVYEFTINRNGNVIEEIDYQKGGEQYTTYISNPEGLEIHGVKAFKFSSYKKAVEFFKQTRKYYVKLKITGVENEDILFKEVIAINKVAALTMCKAMYNSQENFWSYNDCLYEVLEVV